MITCGLIYLEEKGTCVKLYLENLFGVGIGERKLIQMRHYELGCVFQLNQNICFEISQFMAFLSYLQKIMKIK